MVVDFETFRAAVSILRNNTFQDILNSLQSSRNHLVQTEYDYKRLIDELKRMVVNFKNYENDMLFKKTLIEANDILAWSPILKQHQDSSIFPSLKTKSVQKIIESKKEMENIDSSIGEVKIRLLTKARQAKEAKQAVDTVKEQIRVLEVASDVFGFLTTLGYEAGNIADYEMSKYFDIYSKGGGVGG
jgi:hypothetical protein